VTARDSDAAKRSGAEHAPQPVRVAYVIGELNKGGAEWQLHELLRGLDRDRFVPAVFALAEGGYWAGPIRDLGIQLEELPHRGSADIRRLLRLRRHLRAFAPAILHTILWSGNVYGRLAAVGLGIPVVIAAERNVIERPRWQILLERLLDRLTSCYLLNSHAIAHVLVERQGLPAAKMRVVHNGIDLDRMPSFGLPREAARRKLGFDPRRRLVAQVGRLAEQKDWPTFLAAAAQVARAAPDVDILAIGEGPLRQTLERCAADLGLEGRICFLGLRHDVPAILAAVDVMVLSSLYEGLPNVVLEAMATGAVVVATDVGGTSELLRDGETGVLVPPRSPERIAQAVLAVLGDPGWAGRLARAARARVEGEFTPQAMVRGTTAVYEEHLQPVRARLTRAAA